MRKLQSNFIPLAGGALLDLLSPGYCRECRREVQLSAVPYCTDCRQRIRWIFWACWRCGAVLPQPAGAGSNAASAVTDCGSCDRHGRLAAATAIAGLYDGPLRSAIVRYKFHGDVGVRPLLLEAAQHAATRPWMESALRAAEVLVPVPQHWTKTFWRGRNPLLELAEDVAAGSFLEVSLPVASLLRKRRWTPPQVRLSGRLRRRNLRGSFALSCDRLRARRIVLFDDVVTTGTTLAECTRVLRRAGAESVAIIVLAGAPRTVER